MRYVPAKKLIETSVELKIRINPQSVDYFVPTHKLRARQIEKSIKRSKTLNHISKISTKIISLSKSYSNAYIDFENLDKTRISTFSRYIETQKIVADFISGNNSLDFQGGAFKTPGLIASLLENGALCSSEFLGDSYKPNQPGFGEHSLFGIGPNKEIFKVDKGETRFYISRALQLDSFPVVFCYVDKSHHDEVVSVGLKEFLKSLQSSKGLC